MRHNIVVLNTETNREITLVDSVDEEWIAASAGQTWATLFPQDIVMLVSA
jgi:hypothetical protein